MNVISFERGQLAIYTYKPYASGIVQKSPEQWEVKILRVLQDDTYEIQFEDSADPSRRVKGSTLSPLPEKRGVKK